MSKQKQLGMNPATASNRLVKDLLFSFVANSGAVCHRCGGELTRDTFSIEHIDPWLHAENPTDKFFDIDNIAYSHKECNFAAARRPNKTYTSPAEQKRESFRRLYDDPVKRKEWNDKRNDRRRSRESLPAPAS